MNKSLKVMTSAALLAGVVAPVAVTTVDAANSKVIVEKTPTVAKDYDSTKASGSYQNSDAITHVVFQTDDAGVYTGDRFRLTLPDGVKFVEEAYDGARAYAFTTQDKVQVKYVSEQTLELEITDNVASGKQNIVRLPLFVEVDTTGELKFTVDPLDSSLTAGTYTFAVAQGGSATATIEKVSSVGSGVSPLSVIRIDENAVNALGKDQQTITLKLPNNVEWNNTPTVEFTGGLTGSTLVSVTPSGRTLTIKFDPTDNRTARGSIFIKNAEIDVDEDAKFGEIVVDITGTEVDSQDLVVAEYADYGVSITLENEVPEIVAGAHPDGGADKDDLVTAKIKIKENVADSIASGRETKVEFPSWVKIIDVKTSDEKNVSFSKTGFNKDKNEFKFTATTSGKAEFVVKFYLSVQADKAGDITAKISGRAGIEGEAVVAKAIAPVSVEVKAADLQIGQKDQTLADIIITENVKEAIKDGKLKITLPNNVSFSEEPTVEVVEGNIEIDDVALADYDNGDDNVLELKVKGESTKPSKIKISGAKITLDRTVPVGPIVAKLGGDLVQNTTDDAVDYDTKFEDKDFVSKFVIANVVTPAPGQSVAQEVKFTIGSTTYTVGDEEKTMDVAPFVEGGRAYMPIRYVAEAVGVSKDSIFWDQATQTATLIKGDRVVQLTAGSKSLKINGASIAMDAAAQVKDGRVVLPIRFVGQALGANVDWNQADQTVTVK
ncbi:copper amine oxidase N-terminal domain-containing protein [Calidifontibacillus erzurumensis]|uniref:Copper amine oxidase N-terminal domain-containing protein n=1 Tax=Calidifontibacillus erzurumensis TaxID=2741433 RepID=A0A8J8KEP6_9BACI|nr:copper amine oxidase N-terminal domain-containing protein [Calidifontibacillus erzurumensis]NSL52045.1 copper amine oxidase N-terminal domain-containing protein [Calidifontibacillus erzurumensis]